MAFSSFSIRCIAGKSPRECVGKRGVLGVGKHLLLLLAKLAVDYLHVQVRALRVVLRV